MRVSKKEREGVPCVCPAGAMIVLRKRDCTAVSCLFEMIHFGQDLKLRDGERMNPTVVLG